MNEKGTTIIEGDPEITFNAAEDWDMIQRISVERFDLEKLKQLNNEKDMEGIWINNRYIIEKILNKYLED